MNVHNEPSTWRMLLATADTVRELFFKIKSFGFLDTLIL